MNEMFYSILFYSILFNSIPFYSILFLPRRLDDEPVEEVGAGAARDGGIVPHRARPTHLHPAQGNLGVRLLGRGRGRGLGR